MSRSSCLTCPIAAITSSDFSANSAFNREYVIAASLSNWYAGSSRMMVIAPIVLNAAFFWAVDNLIMRKHRGVGGRYNCVLTYG